MVSDMDRFTGRLRVMVAACRELDRLALWDATWEPHDWSTWD